jgi:hypothetical protein
MTARGKAKSGDEKEIGRRTMEKERARGVKT